MIRNANAVLFVALMSLFCGGMPCAAADEFSPRFFAFKNGVAEQSPQAEAKLLKELGYDGVSQVFVGGDALAGRVKAFEQEGLQVLSIYLNVDDQAIDEEVVKPLAGRNAMIELTVRKKSAATVQAIRKTVAMAARHKIQVVLYPHHGFAVATIQQALDLIEKVDHPNLGVMFNLCHFLRNEDPATLEAVIRKAGPHLHAVSTSGADTDGKGWAELIQTLDQGDFPQTRLLKALKDVNFRGPVGLQCYGVKGDRRSNLKRSIQAWQKALAEVNAQDSPD